MVKWRDSAQKTQFFSICSLLTGRRIVDGALDCPSDGHKPRSQLQPIGQGKQLPPESQHPVTVSATLGPAISVYPNHVLNLLLKTNFLTFFSWASPESTNCACCIRSQPQKKILAELCAHNFACESYSSLSKVNVRRNPSLIHLTLVGHSYKRHRAHTERCNPEL